MRVICAGPGCLTPEPALAPDVPVHPLAVVLDDTPRSRRSGLGFMMRRCVEGGVGERDLSTSMFALVGEPIAWKDIAVGGWEPFSDQVALLARGSKSVLATLRRWVKLGMLLARGLGSVAA